MSGREWRLLDVAMRTTAPHLSFQEQCRAVVVRCHSNLHGRGLHWHYEHGGWDPLDVVGPTFRPLVVIDPEDREQVERLYDVIEATQNDVPYDAGDNALIAMMQAALREFANPTPPKPDEPTGLGAVVEDAEGKRFVRLGPSTCGEPWIDAEDEDHPYANISAVRVLSEGVTA